MDQAADSVLVYAAARAEVHVARHRPDRRRGRRRPSVHCKRTRCRPARRARRPRDAPRTRRRRTAIRRPDGRISRPIHARPARSARDRPAPRADSARPVPRQPDVARRSCCPSSAPSMAGIDFADEDGEDVVDRLLENVARPSGNFRRDPSCRRAPDARPARARASMRPSCSADSIREDRDLPARREHVGPSRWMPSFVPTK